MLDKILNRSYNVSYRVFRKLSESENRKIRKMFRSGESLKEIKEECGAVGSTVVAAIREENHISIPDEYISILDKGYVGLVSVSGTELDVVNAARVSYNKQSDSLNENDRSLIRFLMREGHTSPFRHVSMTFECYTPLMVARQHWKYTVASSFVDDQNAWNESSRRYITERPEFYIPTNWREAPAHSKQGSGEDLPEEISYTLTNLLEKYVETGEQLYEFALGEDVAPEQARLFLPAYGMYIRYRWTTSLAGVVNFLDQRLEKDSQYEMQILAKAVYNLIVDRFRTTFGAYFESKNRRV